MERSLEQRIADCERDNAALRRRLKRQNLGWIVALLFAMAGAAIASGKTGIAHFESIQARDITIIDAKGVVRARMSGDMPDAVMAGGRVAKRGAEAAGFMIYDQDGIERGGYVTFDHGNAMLSLDSKHHMVANLIAGPEEEGASVLNLMGGGNAMELRVDSDAARASTSRDRMVQDQFPMIDKLPGETCALMKQLDQQYPDAKVCRTRWTESACSTCLGTP
jgi:hypothetical protein